jgi:putative Mg2+ transporter-C (MgtC) family protein
MLIDGDVIVRLVAAAGLGMALGVEREASDHDAGLRTQVMVATGAALFGVISTLGFQQYHAVPGAQFSVDRVASTVVTGIGFIGAGVIFRRGNRVHNLTTAASVWVSAAIGLSCGIGKIGPAIATAVLVLAALVALRLPRQWMHQHVGWERQSARIVLERGRPHEAVEARVRSLPGVEVEGLGIEKQDNSMVITTELRARPQARIRDQLSRLASLEDVNTLTLDEGYNAE